MVDASGAVETILSGYRQMLTRYQLDVAGDPAALRAAAAGHRAQADKVRAAADAITARAKALGADWEAPEYTAFTNKANDLSTTKIIGSEQVLRQAADRLTGAAGALTDARTRVDAEITKFESQAKVLVTAARSIPDNQVAALFRNARTLGVDACRQAQRIALDLSAKLGGTFGQNSGFRIPEGDITRMYQVPAQAPNNAQWPQERPWRDIFGSRRMTQAELNLLNQLTPTQRVTAAAIALEAEAQARRLYPEPVPHEAQPRTISPDGGHANAFKHTYWSARLAQTLGPQWAEAFTTAHETERGNRPPGQSMDLFNNAVGRQIAAENPGADASILANKVSEAVAQGRTVVVDLDGQIRYSDRIHKGQTGR